MCLVFFFFSSRRRHTIWNCDWSSDVCSSDLVCLTEGGPDVDAAVTFKELDGIFQRRGIVVAEQAEYFTRVPEERRRHLSMAGGLPLEVLLEETQASRRFRKVRGLSGL